MPITRNIIRQNWPKPERPRRPQLLDRYPFDRLCCGESIVVPIAEMAGAQAAASHCRELSQARWGFKRRQDKVAGTVTFWRIL